MLSQCHNLVNIRLVSLKLQLYTIQPYCIYYTSFISVPLTHVYTVFSSYVKSTHIHTGKYNELMYIHIAIPFQGCPCTLVHALSQPRLTL